MKTLKMLALFAALCSGAAYAQTDVINNTAFSVDVTIPPCATVTIPPFTPSTIIPCTAPGTSGICIVSVMDNTCTGVPPSFFPITFDQFNNSPASRVMCDPTIMLNVSWTPSSPTILTIYH